MSLLIEPVRSRRDLVDFVKLPWKIYRNDPAWVPPLIWERLQFLNRGKNPFFDHAEGELLLARRNGETVGRISSQIDHLHEKIHKDGAGFFGFFESIEDREVSHQLLETASEWLRRRGIKKIRGPFNFSINEECGTLTEGFQHPPFILTCHNPPYYPRLLEGDGFKKAKDLFCWCFDPTAKPITEEALSIAQEVSNYPGLRIREINRKSLTSDLEVFLDVFNAAWSRNWGFVPLTRQEMRKAAKDLQLILEPKMTLIAEVDGRPAAICFCLPNINPLIKDLNGRLFPFGLLRFLYRLKCNRATGFRLIALGIKPEYRGSILGGLSLLLYSEIHRRGKSLGLKDCEVGWTLEDNAKINAGIEFMGAEHYKTYRIYEKEL